MATWTRCGICGEKARHVASHVMRVHLPFAGAGPDRIAAELERERALRGK